MLCAIMHHTDAPAYKNAVFCFRFLQEIHVMIGRHFWQSGDRRAFFQPSLEGFETPISAEATVFRLNCDRHKSGLNPVC